MKYPAQQFEILKDALAILTPLYDIKDSNPHTLHYIVYQQLCKEGQGHNHYYIHGNTVKRQGQLSEDEKKIYIKFMDIDFDFVLYPNGCTDDHISTAMKTAIKQLNKEK